MTKLKKMKKYLKRWGIIMGIVKVYNIILTYLWENNDYLKNPEIFYKKVSLEEIKKESGFDLFEPFSDNIDINFWLNDADVTVSVVKKEVSCKIFLN